MLGRSTRKAIIIILAVILSLGLLGLVAWLFESAGWSDKEALSLVLVLVLVAVSLWIFNIAHSQGTRSYSLWLKRRSLEKRDRFDDEFGVPFSDPYWDKVEWIAGVLLICALSIGLWLLLDLIGDLLGG